MSTTTQHSRTIYIGAVVALIFIATAGAILRLMFVRRMRRRYNAPLVTAVIPPYPQNSNIYAGHQHPYVPPPERVLPYPNQRYNSPTYPNYASPYSMPYSPRSERMSFPPPAGPVNRPMGFTPAPISPPRVNPPPIPPSDQDGRAPSRYGTQPTVPATGGRRTAQGNTTMPNDGLGPPPAYTLDGRDS